MCIITEKYPIQRATEELASTPSSATLTFSFSKDEKEYDKASLHSSQKTSSSYYGSTTENRPITTVSPNDDDEGLYLLWTHQLLKERGYKPFPLKQILDDDTYSIDNSSITGKSYTLNSSWFSSCFPFCC